MKTLSSKLVTCLEYSLPSGEYAIVEVLPIKLLSPFHEEGNSKPLVNATLVTLACWDRRTGATYEYTLTCVYRRGGVWKQGNWFCINTVQDLRHPAMSRSAATLGRKAYGFY